MKTIAILNQKGGVGKTTTALCLGTGLALRGKTVLMIDNDPQASLTLTCGYNCDSKELNGLRLGDVMSGKMPIADCALNIPNISDYIDARVNKAVNAEARKFFRPIDALKREERLKQIRDAGQEAYGALRDMMLVTSSFDLAAEEAKMLEKQPMSRHRGYLKAELEKIKEYVDYCIIDCPPAFTLLTQSALAAADEVIIPVTCEYLAYSGLASMERAVEFIRSTPEGNRELKITGIIVQMYSGNKKMRTQAEIMENLEQDPRYLGAVKRSVLVSDSQIEGVPVLLTDPNSEPAKEYLEITDKLLAKEA